MHWKLWKPWFIVCCPISPVTTGSFSKQKCSGHFQHRGTAWPSCCPPGMPCPVGLLGQCYLPLTLLATTKAEMQIENNLCKEVFKGGFDVLKRFSSEVLCCLNVFQNLRTGELLQCIQGWSQCWKPAEHLENQLPFLEQGQNFVIIEFISFTLT